MRTRMIISSPSKLLAEQRRRKVTDLLEQKGQVTVRDLVEKFGISAVTARGDLDSLAADGSAIRSHGGAVRRIEADQDYPLRLKEMLHRGEKMRIGRAAAELVQPNEVVVLDSGTTTAEVARQIKARKIQHVTIITNALNIASELIEASGISVILIGGLLRPVLAPLWVRKLRTCSRNFTPIDCSSGLMVLT